MNKKHCKLSRYKLAIVGYVGSTVSVYISIRFPHSINESTNCRTYQALLATIRFYAFRKIVFEPFMSRTCLLNMNDGQLSNNLMRKIKIRNYLSIQFYTNDSYEIFRIIQNLPLILYRNNNNNGYINRGFWKYKLDILECIKKELLLPRKENSHK